MTLRDEASARDIRTCRNDGEPLVFTMEFPKSEWYCVVCGGHEDLFGVRSLATPRLRARLGELTEQYERERAAQRGVEYVSAPRAGDTDVALPTCGGCGVQPEVGQPLYGGKPREWFSREIDGQKSYACSRTCIPSGESILPW